MRSTRFGSRYYSLRRRKTIPYRRRRYPTRATTRTRRRQYRRMPPHRRYKKKGGAIKQVTNVITLYCLLEEKQEKTEWITFPRPPDKGFTWETNPSTLQAHCGNVMTRNLFNTYKNKLLKKVHISIKQIGRMYVQKEPVAIEGTTTARLKVQGSITSGQFIMSPDLTFYSEKGTREADAHPTDLIGTSRNYRGQKTGRNYNYTWIPGCKEIITKTYDELAKVKEWTNPFSNDTTMGSGIFACLSQKTLERLKYPPQCYTKQVEFAEGFTTKFEITVKTTWSMWTLLKKYVPPPGVTFDDLSIKDNEFYSSWGVIIPYLAGGASLRVKAVEVSATDKVLNLITENDDKYSIGEFVINRQ